MSIVITADDLQKYSGGETLDADQAAQVVDAVNEYIESVTGRSYGEVQSGSETHDWAPVIFLRHPDVVTMTEVEVGNGSGTRTTLDADTYYVNNVGRLVLSQYRNHLFSPYRDYVTVTYTHGTTEVPADLKLAALSLASDFYDYANSSNAEVSSESIGSYQLQFARGTSTSVGNAYQQTINRYRMRRV